MMLLINKDFKKCKMHVILLALLISLIGNYANFRMNIKQSLEFWRCKKQLFLFNMKINLIHLLISIQTILQKAHKTVT